LVKIIRPLSNLSMRLWPKTIYPEDEWTGNGSGTGWW